MQLNGYQIQVRNQSLTRVVTVKCPDSGSTELKLQVHVPQLVLGLMVVQLESLFSLESGGV